MTRTASLFCATLLLAIFALPWATPISPLEPEVTQSTDARGGFQINTTVWTGSPGDFFEFDGNPFGEMIVAELTNPEEGGFDRATINYISSIQRFILPDQDCSFDGSPVICHVITETIELNLTAYDDENNIQLTYEMAEELVTYIHPDMNGWEKSKRLVVIQLWMREQDTGGLMEEDVGWENTTTIQHTTGIPSLINEGDTWTQMDNIQENWADEWESGSTDSGSEEWWDNFTLEATQLTAVDLPPNEAYPEEGGVILDAILIEKITEDGDFEGKEAMSEYYFPLRMYFDESDFGSEILSWRFQAQGMQDADGDGVSDTDDRCPNTVDGVEVDEDGCSWAQRDDDEDGVPNPEDQCEGYDDSIDVDADGIIDGCDELIDSDADGIGDAEDQCPGANDTIDVDGDGIIDCLDPLIDSDGDMVSDENDLCPGYDDNKDVDADNVPDDCDALIDSDGDSVADSEDVCPGSRDDLDIDADGIADGCDDLIDSDGDGVSDYDDACHGHDDSIDIDADGIADGCDVLIDVDDDGVADENDICPDTPDYEISYLTGCSFSQIDTDGDSVMDNVDVCKYISAGSFDTNPTDGCPDDSDADGHLDEVDDCPTSAADVEIDENGCEIIPEAEPEGSLMGTTGLVVMGVGVVLGILLVGLLVTVVIRGGGSKSEGLTTSMATTSQTSVHAPCTTCGGAPQETVHDGNRWTYCQTCRQWLNHLGPE
ncbi:MAG: thrombospondin type 3 repeat-containing protein [Candidatus Poseidoniales archaeon]|nr:thrombospondin type 3 repeat-containing protein [Candidatus Poseidoniales archaeon]